ncbi:MAG: hypothetical protein MJ150_00780 [Clostridia bacterium]|nr:hypothetical protein [Clostridia bacterium]
MKKLFSLLLCFLIILSSKNYSFALTINYGSAKHLGTISGVYTKELWHYSEGYWTIESDDGSKGRIEDSEMSEAANIGNYLKFRGFDFMIPLPIEVIEAYNNGDYITFSVEETTMRLTDLFDTPSFYGRIQDNYLVLHANPAMRNFGAATFATFINRANRLPLVDIAYGNNLYKIYKFSKFQGIAVGKFILGDDSITVIDNCLHPAMIKDYNGTLNPGYMIRIDNNAPVSTTGLTVGNRTFKDGGDLGYRFIYPFAVSFTGYKYEKEIVPDPPEDPSIPSDEENLEAAILAAASKWKLHRVK